MATTIEQNICDAIDIIVDKAISEASYDRTVQAIIVTCIDESLGYYKVKYQDSTFYAYSTSTDITYTTGTSVYVLIPGNDMSQDKTILGTTKKLGSNYVTVTESDAQFEITGTNTISSSTTFTLSSYKEGTQVIVLYSKDYSEDENLIDLDTTAINEYFANSNYIICGGAIRTALSKEQQYRGNYGIIFALDFLDNTENEVVTRYYVIDVDKMTGNPYKLIMDTRQYGIFEIDSANFLDVNYISIFCYDFPNSLPDDQCVDDIFISALELSGANRLDDDDINNYSLTFTTPQGTYFTSSNLDSDTLTIEAVFRIQGKVVDTDAQDIPFYWAIEHVGITSQSQYYCTYDGQGWKCLNNYNVIRGTDETEDVVIEWIPASSIFTVSKSDIVAKEVNYKCAIVYDGNIISKTITIKNLDSQYDLSIESDCGTQFYFDIGYPTLTCYINGMENTDINYTYSWGVTNNTGNFETIAETPELNKAYEEILEEYNQLIMDIANETKMASANGEQLIELENALTDYETIMRVDRNKIYHLNVNTITAFSTYQCTVYYNNTYIGTTSITLLNTLAVEGVYSLIINDSTYTYKYDENGLSPACSAVKSPIDIKALTFTVYDNLGQAIDDDIIRHCDIEWIVPTTNTLLEIPSSYTASSIDLVNNTATYNSLMSFTYNIADRYDITKTNNDIYLTVVYKGMSLSAKTNLTFIKEGETGTNGTEFTCKIVPNVASGTESPKYWIITENTNGSYTHNFTPINSGKYLKVQLYHNENLVFNNVVSGTTTEGNDVALTWSILANKYTSNVSDPSSLSVNAATGAFTYSGYNSGCPANIVKVTLVSDGVTYYATFPVITIKLNDNNYNIALKENTGFLYAIYTSDGQSPKYDNTNPFEITVNRLIDDYWEDVSTLTSSDYLMTYDWNYLGKIYEDQWKDNINLTDKVVTTTLTNNQKAIKPVDSYDGQCVTNAVQCTISHNGTEVAYIHIPIHLYLNRYGLSYLNSWDGNSVEISSEGGFILAPQVGAGIKESDNSFTGVLMGVVKESGSTETETGLFGYHQGIRTIFLDSSSGKSEFGANGSAQIIIDPSNDTAQIYSGNYYDNSENGTGLMIDLTTPYIKFGSGNFYVDEDGNLTAKGGGNIAGFYIDDDSLWTGNKDKTNINTFRISSADFERTVNRQDVINLRIVSSNNWGVDSDGTMYAAEGIIGSGSSNKITLGCSSNNSSYSALYSKKDAFNSTSSGFYLGTDGIALGSYSNNHSKFQVDDSGNLIAASGYIGDGSNGWEIGDTFLRNGLKEDYNDSNSGIYISTYGIGLGTSFWVSRAGQIYADRGTIGGLTLSNSDLSYSSGNNNFYISANSGSIYSNGSKGSWYINSDGTASFNSATITGTIYATSGTVGGWTINSSSISASGITLDSTGTIYATNGNWYLYSNGNATFKGSVNISGSATIDGATINNSSLSGTTLSGGTTISGDTTVKDSSGNSYSGVGSSSYETVKYISSIQNLSIGINKLTYSSYTALRIGVSFTYTTGNLIILHGLITNCNDSASGTTSVSSNNEINITDLWST